MKQLPEALLLFQAQQVQLVSNESWWSHNSGSILIAIAAIGAAGLAAYVAVHNHKEQLRHDRELRNRDAIRNTIDLAVDGITEAVFRTAAFDTEVHGLEEAHTHLNAVDQKDEQSLASAQAALNKHEKSLIAAITPAYESANAMNSHTMRLAIRLGDEHPVTAHHQAARESLDRWHDAISVGVDAGRNQEQIKETQERLQEFRRARTRFDQACRSWLNE